MYYERNSTDSELNCQIVRSPYFPLQLPVFNIFRGLNEKHSGPLEKKGNQWSVNLAADPPVRLVLGMNNCVMLGSLPPAMPNLRELNTAREVSR